ncbi:hypothetical protein [Tropicibacter alexandrii]|uniref:hypothetical protein n=1 Tax=Tropicibacter alexandrii TaxID=2267683 RepID=UPI0013E8C02F|nr:hypothetical protein [Tropicibacter alexandrii]
MTLEAALLALVSALFFVLVALLGWIGSRFFRRLDDLSGCVTSLEKSVAVILHKLEL